MTALEQFFYGEFVDFIIQGVLTGTWPHKQLLALNYITDLLKNDERYASTRHLCRFGYQIHSQNSEDGMIAEIFKRIGVTNKYFVEVGVGDGMENNTVALFLSGWSGSWVDCDPNCIKSIQTSHRFLIEKQKLSLAHAFVDMENVDAVLDALGVPAVFDFFSIDIDGMDYWVWKGMKRHRPRVVCIEYASSFPPPLKYILKYNPKWLEHQSMYISASLQSLTDLALEKDMVPVGCDVTGINAFFVDKESAKDKFDEPFTAMNHYEPPRMYLSMRWGHKRTILEYITEDKR